ncbi:MAG TPA: bifunctional nuclease family protein [Anaerolineales bacterium]|nr:bifunctional nuclease family protein [Anaerolineales bacterium]
MIEVMIDSVRVNLMSPQRLVILREVGSDRYLPIWVGQYEAEAITVGLQEVEVSRPLTHDLLKNVFVTFNAKIKRIEIISLKEDIFYGNIVAEVNGKEINVDSRPSDAIALAVRAHAPILVDENVMKNAGITPEADMKTSAGPAAPGPAKTRPASPVGDVSSERLSVFEDFVDKLDLDKLDDKDKPEDKGEDDKPDKPGKPKKQ